MATDEKPKPSREETTNCVHELYRGSRPHSEGPLLVSDFPRTPDTDHDGVIMGIDEAGRGPILGPMTYAAAYWKKGENIPKGYNDSKQMKASTRSQLFEATLDSPSIGFVIRVLHATEISQCMLRKVNYNLNAMSHDAAMQMVRAVLKMGVKIKRCYIDTVGREDVYKAKLDKAFAGSDIEFVVEKKADAKYVQCSAASVLAKVTRDRIIENWSFTETSYGTSLDFGSGYPSDPKCKEWMTKNLQDPVFGYPDLVRFSWAPAKDALYKNAATVEWEAEEEDDDLERGAMAAFIAGNGSSNKKPRLDYFERRKLDRVTVLPTR
mmetsp:Transcript_7603/g.11614  ORF Transcript_7603/g.11614 Transcript_7603/m.11614 type:complete len:322 (-) Transcript_7603:41-1006(-)